MHKFQVVLVMAILLFSLAGFYSLYRFLYRKTVSRRSFSRLLLFFFLVVLAVFLYTFLVVLLIRLLFPQA